MNDAPDNLNLQPGADGGSPSAREFDSGFLPNGLRSFVEGGVALLTKPFIRKLNRNFARCVVSIRADDATGFEFHEEDPGQYVMVGLHDEDTEAQEPLEEGDLYLIDQITNILINIILAGPDENGYITVEADTGGTVTKFFDGVLRFAEMTSGNLTDGDHEPVKFYVEQDGDGKAVVTAEVEVGGGGGGGDDTGIITVKDDDGDAFTRNDDGVVQFIGDDTTGKVPVRSDGDDNGGGANDILMKLWIDEADLPDPGISDEGGVTGGVYVDYWLNVGADPGSNKYYIDGGTAIDWRGRAFLVRMYGDRDTEANARTILWDRPTASRDDVYGDNFTSTGDVMLGSINDVFGVGSNMRLYMETDSGSATGRMYLQRTDGAWSTAGQIRVIARASAVKTEADFDVT